MTTWELLVSQCLSRRPPPVDLKAVEVRHCEVCGKSFEPKSGKQKVCGTECRKQMQAEYFRVYRKTH